MKKIILIVLIIIFSLIFYNRKDYIINEDSIRFRVIANSNNMNDIIMKEKVVSELSKYLFIKENSKEKMNNYIYKNLKNIEDSITKIFKDNNYDKSFKISFGKNEFPRKNYRGKTYEEGLYDSLVIEIGEAKGNNYFCILYPSLCVLDYEEKEEKGKINIKLFELIKNNF